MSQSEEEHNIPDRETCQKLTEQFAEITGTDEACAQFYLQDRDWDLERSVNAFFEVSQTGGVSILHDGDAAGIVINVDKKMVEVLSKAQPTTEPPPRFSFVTWNLDGLDDHNLKKRTKAVCKIVATVIYDSSSEEDGSLAKVIVLQMWECPDIVFFQEMIPETFSYVEEKLPEYMCIAGNVEGYFTATLLRRFTVYFDSHKIHEFPGSLMCRNLITVNAHIGPLKLLLLNTHLESTVDHAAERVKQLKECFKVTLEAPEDTTVIFAGDLNLRDKELEQLGGLPPGVEDLWKTCGSRKECQYTWDMLRNSNKEFPGRFKPRSRFDRIYLRHSHPQRVVPVHFGLLGIEKVSGTQTFPSDHWGLRVFFNIRKL
uniref:Tyrosyl-DNA phosphodiesterase 2 n=2 Tax=Timema TaxID=61471 RepID=A0A7R9IG95_9NEOP|nr:unnamed protein product [Timema bartmani]CAD7457834.1 unnamed protein product [Timema tahoe]